MDGGAVKKALTASIAPAMDLAAGGMMIAGGNGPVKGIRIAGVVIEDASSGGEGGGIILIGLRLGELEGLAMKSGGDSDLLLVFLISLEPSFRGGLRRSLWRFQVLADSFRRWYRTRP